MAHLVWLYATTGDPVVQRLLPQLVDAAVARVPGTTAVDYHDGVGMAYCDLVSPGHDGGVTVQVFTMPDRVRPSVQKRLEDGGPARLVECDTLVELFLYGDLDWMVVRAIFKMAADRWSAVLEDEMSGFDLLIEDEV